MAQRNPPTGDNKRFKIEAEKLAYWYLRLNGFLTIENFIVHDEQGGCQKTDIDLVAARFPHRREVLREYGNGQVWMEDNQEFAKRTKLFVAFAEVTTGRCKLNGPWTDRSKGNMPRALRALGALPSDCDVDRASDELYRVGQHQSQFVDFALIAFGKSVNSELSERTPSAIQIVWKSVMDFIFDRFREFESVKREHPQWDLDGHLLWKVYSDNRNDKKKFTSSLILVSNTLSNKEIEEYKDSKIYKH